MGERHQGIMQPWPVAVFLGLALWVLAVGWLPGRHPGRPAAAYWLAAAAASGCMALALVVSRRAELAVGRRNSTGYRSEVWQGLVGPAVTGTGGVVTGVATEVLRSVGMTGLPPEATEWAARTLLAVAAIRLAPVPPLDGYHILRALLWRVTGDTLSARLLAARLVRALALAVMVAGLIQSLYSERGWGYVVALAAWLVMVASRLEEVRARAALEFEGLFVRDVMQPAPARTAGWLLLDAFMEAQPQPTAERPVLVDRFDGQCGGLLEERALRGVPPKQRSAVRAVDLATPLEDLMITQPDEPMADLFAASRRPIGPSGVLVVEGHQPVGWIAMDEVRRRLVTPPRRGGRTRRGRPHGLGH